MTVYVVVTRGSGRIYHSPSRRTWRLQHSLTWRVIHWKRSQDHLRYDSTHFKDPMTLLSSSQLPVRMNVCYPSKVYYRRAYAFPTVIKMLLNELTSRERGRSLWVQPFIYCVYKKRYILNYFNAGSGDEWHGETWRIWKFGGSTNFHFFL